MKIAIMQPYFFPYLGYFQLIHAVDIFVVFDDVNYINRGWINRNNILNQGYSQLITLETIGASQNRLINQIEVGHNQIKLLKTIRYNYVNAPQFTEFFPLVEEIIRQDERNLAKFLVMGLQGVCNYLDQKLEWKFSSNLKKDNGLRGQEKVLTICKLLGASHYINLPGGKTLYNFDTFAQEGIQLSFINPKPINYRQFNGEFIPNLSILDIIMFNDKEKCRQLLREYELV